MPNSVERPTAGPHDGEELADVDALLDVVGQVEVRVVEAVGGARACASSGCARPTMSTSMASAANAAAKDVERTDDRRVMVVFSIRSSARG
jgi:hypothetical protein